MSGGTVLLPNKKFTLRTNWD